MIYLIAHSATEAVRNEAAVLPLMKDASLKSSVGTKAQEVTKETIFVPN